MKTVPLLCEGKTIGQMQVEQEGEDTVFSACGQPPGNGLWCLWAVGQNSILRLGCPESAGEGFQLSRRFSSRMTVSLGQILRGELRTVQAVSGWEKLNAPERFFRAEELRRGLREQGEVLVQQKGERQFLAIPYAAEKPFPMTGLFCFARICRIQGGVYAVFAFRGEKPVFQNMEKP
jgi:hypothetical protein